MTEKTYYNQPYTRTITAYVKTIVPYKKRWSIELDRTIFYPEGGGQPGDQGDIEGCTIINTIKHDGSILHLTDAEPMITVGQEVVCSIDWSHRYDYMQQHTGQHIISGVLYRELKIGTVSVHQGEEYMTIETDRKMITDDEIIVIEDAANRIISENHSIWYDEKSEEDVADIPLRRTPKVKGMIRLVTIDTCDIAACGGIHLHTTGEVLLIKCIGTEVIRGRVRLIFKIGDRAVEDYRNKDLIVRQLVKLYSAQQPEILDQARHRIDQIKELQTSSAVIERKYMSMLLSQAITKSDQVENISIVTLDLSQEAPGVLKEIVKVLPQNQPLALCAVQEQQHGGLQWLITVTKGVNMDISIVRDRLFPLIHAKGGGKSPVWQGMGTDASGKEQFLAVFKELFIHQEN